jgi:hypothetical protein
MATADERLKILKLIQKGTITAEEGAQLIEALGDAGGASERRSFQHETPMPAVRAGAGRWFRVRITDMDSGKTRVNVRMPMSLVNAGLKMGARFGFATEIEGLKADQLSEIINSGELGQIVDVYDSEDGEHIEVFVE